MAEASRRASSLDAFYIDGFLPDLYGNHGFRPAARVKFNPEYAPEGWMPEHGASDVVLMVRDVDGVTGLPEVPDRDSGGYTSIKDQVPVFEDWEQAAEAQDAAIAKGRQSFPDYSKPYPDSDEASSKAEAELREPRAEITLEQERCPKGSPKGGQFGPREPVDVQSNRNSQEDSRRNQHTD